MIKQQQSDYYSEFENKYSKPRNLFIDSFKSCRHIQNVFVMLKGFPCLNKIYIFFLLRKIFWYQINFKLCLITNRNELNKKSLLIQNICKIFMENIMIHPVACKPVVCMSSSHSKNQFSNILKKRFPIFKTYIIT